MKQITEKLSRVFGSLKQITENKEISKWVGREYKYHTSLQGQQEIKIDILTRELKQQSLSKVQGWTLYLSWTGKEVKTKNTWLF